MTARIADAIVSWHMNSVLLIVRVALGFYLMADGTAKLSGLLGRGAPAGPAVAMGAIELAGGVLAALGLFTPLSGLLLVGVTASLAFVSWPHEYPLYMLFAAVAIALAGPGDYSLDHAVRASSAGAPGTQAVAVGLAGAAIVEGLRQLQRQRAAFRAGVATSDQDHGSALDQLS
jgi:putative oxidoreductase